MKGASGMGIRWGISALALVGAAGIGLAQQAVAGEASFTVTIEQLTTEQTLKLPDGSATKAPISPGTAVVHSDANRCSRSVSRRAWGRSDRPRPVSPRI